MSKLFLIFALSLLVCALSEPIPAGSYCGTYADEVKVSITILSAQWIRINGSAFGTSVGCPKEAAEYVAASHSVTLTDINAPSDCLGTILRSYSVDPAGVSIVYDPASNTIDVGADGISFSLAKCNTQNFWSASTIRPHTTKKDIFPRYGGVQEAVPNGVYCGGYGTDAVVKATVISLTSFNLAATIFGVSDSCINEGAAYNPTSHAITFPNVNAPSDCLGATLRDLSINPDTVTVTFNPTEDSVLVTGPAGVSFTLTKKCNFKEEVYVNKHFGHLLKAEEPEGPIPAGAYCGTYLDVVTIRATVISLTEVNLAGSVLGFGVTCPTEDVAFNQATDVVTFPNIAAPADCLGKLLTSYGLNPASLSGKYDPTANTLAITVESVTLSLTQCKPEQLMVNFGYLKTPNKFHQARIAYLYETREQ